MFLVRGIVFSHEAVREVHEHWRYLYRAIDRSGALVDVMFSEHREMAAAKAFFLSAKTVTDATPDRVNPDGHDSFARCGWSRQTRPQTTYPTGSSTTTGIWRWVFFA
jgi:transposase-like protein